MPPDALALAAYNNAGTTYNAYFNAFLRQSWNNASAPIRLVNHYLMPPSLAFYGQGGYLVFSDGIDNVIKSGAQDLDTVAHEFGHGVIEAETGFVSTLDTVDGAAALNEAYGDWSATVADHYVRSAVTNQTWAMLQLDPSNPDAGQRYWNFPILADVRYRDWYPQRTFITLGEGGAYLNTTIMGHAFYLLTSGGQHYRAGTTGSNIPVIPVTGWVTPTLAKSSMTRSVILSWGLPQLFST